MNAPVAWLLEGEPWIEYRTRRDLLGQPEKDPLVKCARKSMLANAHVHNLVAELLEWPGNVISSHKSASQPPQFLLLLLFFIRLLIKAIDSLLPHALAPIARPAIFPSGSMMNVVGIALMP